MALTEKTMKKVLTIITLTSAIFIKMTPVFALEFENAAAADAWYKKEAEEWAPTFDRIFKAVENNDDLALKKGIFELTFLIGYSGRHSDVLRGLVDTDQIPRERVFKVLTEAIQEGLSDLSDEDDAKRIRAHNKVYFGIGFLAAVPGEDTLALLKECLQVEDNGIRNEATWYYNIVAKKVQDLSKENVKIEPVPVATQDQPKPDDNGETVSQPEPNIQIIAEPISLPPIPEPPPPAITNETAQLTQEIPPEQPKKSPSNKSLLWGVVIALLAAIGGVAVWRKK